MRKYSRRHGSMVLSVWAPGDGSMAFSWLDGATGAQVPEPVTESDVSEHLRDLAEEEKWMGWEIVMVSGKPRLARPAKRPVHTSRKLVMGGVEYEYSTSENLRRDQETPYTCVNTEFRCGFELAPAEVALSLVFFLNHEDEFRASGHETRERGQA